MHVRPALLVVGTVVVAVVASVAGEGTDAAFTGSGGTPFEASLTALGAPSSLNAAPVGDNVSLSWAAGSNGTGYRVRVADLGTGDSCTGAVFSTAAEPTTTSYVDSVDGPAPGLRRCYGILTTLGPWTSVRDNPAAVVRVGFVAQSLVVAGGACGLAGALDCGDVVTVEFNQPVASDLGPSASYTVCTDPVADAIVVGAVLTAGTCSAGESALVGTLVGGTVEGNARYQADYAWSNGDRTLTVTVGSRVGGGADATVGAAVWTYTPQGLVSATGSVAVCGSDASGGDCLPETSGTAAP